MMSLVAEGNGEFEKHTLRLLAASKQFQLFYIPSFEADDDRLQIYQQLLRAHSSQPDLLEIDVIWPQLLSEGLIDLKPYFASDLGSYPPDLLKTFTVNSRLVGIPVFLDTGLLYYRADLLQKYGYTHPPETWDELEMMARVVQEGERRAGKKEFWGYIWQGHASEALTCNALEWQLSQGGGQLLNENRTVSVYNPRAVHALRRAVSWIGTISPPGVIAYNEDDALNVWQSGNAVFMRSWVYTYGVLKQNKLLADKFGAALLPKGISGRSRTLGDFAIGISKYSEHVDLAVAALRQLTSDETQRARATQIGSVPTRLSLERDPAVMQNTPFHGALANEVMTGVTSRPSILAGNSYDRVSRAYFEGIHAALTHQLTPEQALAKIQKQLIAITGFAPASTY